MELKQSSEHVESDLNSLVTRFLEVKSFNKLKNLMITGNSGQEYHFDYLLRKEAVSAKDSLEWLKPSPGDTGIIIKDYQKPVGSDAVTKAEKMGKDCGFGTIMLCSNTFSPTAKSLAKRSNIITLSRDELESILRQYSVKIDA